MDASESLESTAKPLTLASPPSIRAALAAGAIPPPLFFGRRRVPPERIGLVAHRLRIDRGGRILKDTRNPAASVRRLSDRSAPVQQIASEPSPPKDI